QVQELDDQLKQKRERLAAVRPAGGAGESAGDGYHRGIEKTHRVAEWGQVGLGRALPQDEIRLIPARPVDFPDTPGFGFPLRFRVEVSDDPAFAAAQTVCDHTKADFKKVLDEPISFSAAGKTGQFVRVTVTRLWERT